MFKHLLVPLDGSRLAEAVLSPVELIAAKCGAAVTLFHVLEQHPPEQIHGEPHLAEAGAAAGYLGSVADRLRGKGLTVDLHVHDEPEGDVARSITRHAHEYGSDLIVLATHGSGGMREMVFGSIAQQVIGCGPTPVLVIHPEGMDDPFELHKLLIPWDGKPGHSSSIPLARELAGVMEASAQFVSVVPKRTDLGGTTEGAVGKLLPTAMAALLDHREAETERQLAELAQEWQADGVPTRARVLRGDPTTMILQALKEQQSDLLILATHTKKGWSAFWSGSVAPRVMSQWHRATLLVRANPI